MSSYFIAARPSKKIILIDDNKTVWWIGNEENNPDYQAWLEAGNTPEPWQPETTVVDVPVEDVIEDGD